ncbi:MAG TPA: hypothetical protein VH917_02055 [Ignavibacteriaceae bacterium]
MSFYPQPNKYQCGPFALKYALIMLGIFEHERVISKKAGSNWWRGTDEIGLAKAANTYDCKMKYFRRETGTDGIKILTKLLRRGYPCILSVDNWGHWFTVVNWQQGKFVVIDSSLEKVVVVYSARQIIKRWKFKDPDNDFISFDGYAVIPNFKIRAKAKLTLSEARHVMQKTNNDLAKNWDTYFNDLITICRPLTATALHTITFNEFLRRHEKLLVEQVANWHGSPSYSELKAILKKMNFVAEVYNLVIYGDQQKKALIDLASLLMMYSCGKYGMKKLY